jgi:hypothetical protein
VLLSKLGTSNSSHSVDEDRLLPALGLAARRYSQSRREVNRAFFHGLLTGLLSSTNESAPATVDTPERSQETLSIPWVSESMKPGSVARGDFACSLALHLCLDKGIREGTGHPVVESRYQVGYLAEM